MSTTHTERREYFRIDDYVRLSYTVVSDLRGLPGVTADAAPESDADLRRDLEAEFNNTLNALWRDYPLAAKALSQLNRKLDLLGASNSGESEMPALAEEPTLVNISGNGIAFSSDSRYPPGQLLDLHIILLPSEAQLRILARVVDSEAIPGTDETDERPYLLRAEFALRDSAAQETLISHIVQRQQAQRAGQSCDAL